MKIYAIASTLLALTVSVVVAGNCNPPHHPACRQGYQPAFGQHQHHVNPTMQASMDFHNRWNNFQASNQEVRVCKALQVLIYRIKSYVIALFLCLLELSGARETIVSSLNLARHTACPRALAGVRAISTSRQSDNASVDGFPQSLEQLSGKQPRGTNE